jgi:phospholipid/cholesterol/gamma-HCH transport system substrate-binding protein
VSRLSPRSLVVVVAVVVVGLLSGGIYALVSGGGRETKITANFLTTPGLYVGNAVRILGMPVGQITKITARGTYVTVQMEIPASQKVPADATAEIMAPNVVNDRFVQLDPPYTGGPTMPNGGLIPASRTFVPISVDEIIDSLNQLAVALGPNGANAHGALQGLIAAAARAFGNNGAALNSTITNLGKGFGALSSQGPDLTNLFDGLGHLSAVASQYSGQYQSFASELAAVSTELASDDSLLGPALANLQQALGALAGFIRSNGSALGGSLANLSQFAGAVAQKQAQLEQVFGVLPVALQNVENAYDPVNHALKARYDPLLNTENDPSAGCSPGTPGSRGCTANPTTDSDGFNQDVCGNALLRVGILALDPSQDPIKAIDLGCGVGGLLIALPSPPGATIGPNLSLSALVGGQE